MYLDISCVEQPYTFPRAKSIKENVEKKINIDVINWEKLFHRSADRKQCNIPWLANYK